MTRHTKTFLIAAIIIAFGVSYFSAQFNRYYLGIAIDIAINIILAVSLNLINGHTGQFSLGHAGFMAVGGYTAASFTWLALNASTPPWLREVIFALALVAGGLMASVSGLAVGIPSLRLRGDYLAIATLGFGEIIRVFLQTTDTLARKMGGDDFITRALDNMGGASG